MSKFKMNSIKDLQKENIESEPQTKKTAVGSWLLDDIEVAPQSLVLKNIKRGDIVKNPNNQYSIKGIPSLAESIKHYGLVQPLHVASMPDGKYKLLGGERRLTAIEMLIEDPNVTEWTEDTLIPCVVKGIDEIDLNLSDENKEQYAIITTNKEQRVYSDSDRYMEIQKWKLIIEELRANGVEYLDHYDDEGNEAPISIKGEKTRDILSQATGISRGQINKFENVHNNASESLVSALIDGKLSISEADKAVKEMDTNEQDEFANKVMQGVPIEEAAEEETETEEYVVVSNETFNNDIQAILDILNGKEIKLDKKQQNKYYRSIQQLVKLLRGHK